MSDRFDFNTPGGRFVGGHPTEKQTHDYQNRPIAPEKQRISVGIAFPKSQDAAAQINVLLGQIYNFALGQYANKPGGQRAYAEAQKFVGDPNAKFSWKIKDGDAPNSDGTFNENTKNCWVFWFSTTIPFKACDGLQGNKEIDPATIKRGWYVDMFGNCSINGLTDDNAGIYLNPSIMRLIGYGPEIVGGPNIQQAFGNVPVPTMPGASTMPVAPAGGIPQAAPTPAPAPVGLPQAAPAGLPQQQPMPGFTPPTAAPTGNALPATGYPSNVQPHTTFVPGAPAPQQAAPAAPVGVPGLPS